MRTHKTRTVMAEINMVPFIDITLILLIIFMVMSPMLVQMQMNVDLPKSNAVNTTAEDDVIRIEVQKNGVIRIDKSKCVGCLTCILVCPYGALAKVENGVMQKCELCLNNSCGEPACVKGCPNRAIVYEER